ncbi:MAG: L-histidine N(alpha)-methyltransferase [Planctomycetota bacterium]|nr:L-histidine N(alpha)-methyltransferase [Planctomycetota bacterium]
MGTSHDLDLVDDSPTANDLAREALAGLRAEPKTLPAKLFYDERGSELFEQICELPEYYLTRTETGILRAHLPEIAAALGPQVQLIEPGSGAGTKTMLLLGALEDPVGYVPIDISHEHLLDAARRTSERFPELEIQPLSGDFLAPLDIPAPARPPRRRIVFFPGSSIGNFQDAAATAFLGRLADMAGPGGGLLIGFDLRKDPAVLVAAYDDAQGVTAAFNRNMLTHLNREAGTDFVPERFRHEARWNEAESRIEMHLVSVDEQEVRIAGETVRFGAGESVRTECCTKYGPEGVTPLTDRFVAQQTWFDDERRFGVQYLEVADA